MRVGIGYDVHKFVDGKRIILGGTEIPYIKKLSGHSDADVLIHAIMDALLGASGLKDIGHHFPPDDLKYKNISSLLLLKEVDRLVKSMEMKVVNIDSTIIAEEPKLAPYIDGMRRHISEALNIEIESVMVKATTNEGLGFIGEKQGIAAIAIASLSD